MISWQLQLITVISTLVIAARIWYDKYIFNKKYRLPPRVPGIPFLGNSLQVPKWHQGPWAMELANKYGEMYTCKLGAHTWVFLNSSRVVNDLLERRSAIYSSRPPFPMASTLMSDDCRIVLQPYGDAWRQTRKIMHGILNRQNLPTYAPFQELESQVLLYDYLHVPEKWYAANQRFSNAVIMSVIFGKRMQLEDPNITALFESAADFAEALQPGAWIVDGFPWLAKLPTFLQWWRRAGLAMRKKTLDCYQNEVTNLERRMASGVARECFATKFLRDPASKKLSHNMRLVTLGSMVEAGSDTTRMILSMIIAAAATDPRWVAEAQKQLDHVCGSNAERLPSFSDKNELPYITATIKEALRWRPVSELGPPILLIQDDEYEGYRFPAGTLFTFNTWNLHLSPDEHKDPHRFWPDRYLNMGKDLSDPLRGHYGFGPGRRACAGYHIGDTNLWIAAARLLYCFNFSEIPGQPIDTLGTNWFEHRHAPFPVKISVRSKGHEELIERAGQSAVDTQY
ncbi:uncharacterized protein Z518_11322 [Rhinocladiella mackenziei CBS 650.93]|uniref:Cytochrome P450 n=1 Tax=Rhinocladiella mackenziei CBS 650.93 TaxID=1442369 RepID=A0A0D2I1I4_9EURO|nr:uncharacterized protein Z518_11322 [Rhinocladiella mackenziei CBS 650.93]KIW99583.1 hypothetical protein Z518_11322 [Rhinocladiella mackenziei CBS 650.93]